MLVSSVSVFFFRDDWQTQNPMGVASNISGVSFAAAIAALSIGRIGMVTLRIFKNKSKEEGRQEERQKILTAVTKIVSEEDLEKIQKLLREEKSS